MSTSSYLFEAFRAHLTSRPRTYADLATGLNLSAGTVKRILSRKHCSTDQLDRICEFQQLDLIDLTRTAPRPHELLEGLT
jgi:hypothetical protein